MTLTTEPLEETPKISLKEIFEKSAVEKFISDPVQIEVDRLRHYNQLVTHFDDDSLRFTLHKFKIPFGCLTTVFGGYTGQFAETLRRIGMHVVFTDPLQEWVEEASRKGFEASKLSVQEMPSELLARTDLFATFECYPDLIGEEEFIYPFMRFLTSSFGIFFVESKETVVSMRKETNGSGEDAGQELGTLRRHFRSLNHVYHIKRKSTKTNALNLYHILADEQVKNLLRIDCHIMKAAYDNFKDDYRITSGDIPFLVSKTNLDESQVMSSLRRVAEISKSMHAPFLKSFPSLAKTLQGELRVGSKRMYFLGDLPRSA